MPHMNRESDHTLLVAVSGGVDSVVLLHRLYKASRRIVVAHVDHGMRVTSQDDCQFVQELAQSYGMPFTSTALTLGKGASEETARIARYRWLDSELRRLNCDRLVLGHTQDDVIETMIINLLRGTGWRGLCSLRSTKNRYRPLLETSKAEIIAYALEQGLTWREDETNDSPTYLRNRIRLQLIPRLTPKKRRMLLALYADQLRLRNLIDLEITRLIDARADHSSLARFDLIMADESSALELLRAWVPIPLEPARLRDLLLFAKTATPGTRWSLNKAHFVRATVDSLVVL